MRIGWENAMRYAALSFCILALSASSAVAAEGELHPDTKARLEQRITLEPRPVHMGEFIEIVSEKTGLSFVVSMDVAHMPQHVMLVANNITAGELVRATAFALRLESTITPEGIVSFRFERDDPRRTISLRRFEEDIAERRRDERRERDMRRERGERPEMPEGEALEIARRHPHVAKMIDGWGAVLIPRKFIPDRGAWALEVRKGEDGPPVGMAIVHPNGEVDVKMRDFGGKEEAPGQWKKRKKERMRDEGEEKDGDRFDFRNRGGEELERF
jgi:hypothetical protein